MRPFEYASPKTKDQVPALLGARWGETEVLAGGTDLLSLMKDEVTAPNRLVNIKGIQDLHGVSNAATGNVIQFIGRQGAALVPSLSPCRR